MSKSNGSVTWAAWKALKRNDLPAYHAFFDAETYVVSEDKGEGVIRHKARLLHATFAEYSKGEWIGEQGFVATSGFESFWQWLAERKPKQQICLWSHNIGFDATVTLLPDLMSRGFAVFPGLLSQEKPGKDNPYPGGRIKYFLPGKPVTVMDMTYIPNDARIRLVDTCNFFRMPLEELGEQIGLPKLAMPPFDDDMEDWKAYCRRDVSIIMEAVRRLLSLCERGEIGPFRPTLGSMSFATLRHKWLRHDVRIRQNKLLRRFERAAYVGGQTECYRPGHVAGPITQVDVVSLYPSIAAELFVPTHVTEMQFRKRDDASKRIDIDGQCIADCLIDTDSLELPYKTVTQTHWLHGEFWSVLCGAELVAAKKAGVIKKVASVCRYSVRPIFQQMYRTLLARRKAALDAGDRFTAKIIKEILNALIGKVGQKADKWVTRGPDMTDAFYGHEMHYDDNAGRFREFRIINGILQESVQADDIAVSFPAISAFVTSAARMRMRALKQIAGERNVYYQATDALHVNGKGFCNLLAAGEIAENTPGKLEVKGTARKVIYRGPNFYCFGGKWVESGKSGRHTPKAEGTYVDMNWESFASAITRVPDSTFHVRKIIKRTKSRRTHGDLTKGGFVIRRQIRLGQRLPYWFHEQFWNGSLSLCSQRSK